MAFRTSKGSINHQTEEEMKTIEEAASEHANSITVQSSFYHIRKESFLEGVEYIKSLPLADRLTSEEKRELRCRYNTNKCVIRDHRKLTGDKAQTRATARIKLLENLFGTAMFEENNSSSN